MSERQFVHPTEWTAAPDVLVRTEAGGRLHIAACPHLGGAIRSATTAERLAMPVCRWCQAELDGVGRTYFDTLDAAMRDFGTYLRTAELIREALRFATYDAIWIPHSRSYVALGHEDRGIAWFGKSYVLAPDGRFIELPGYHAGRGGGSPKPERVGETCPTHHITTSVTGACDLCD